MAGHASLAGRLDGQLIGVTVALLKCVAAGASVLGGWANGRSVGRCACGCVFV